MDYDPYIRSSQLRQIRRPSGVSGWLIKTGLVKDAKQASIMLLVVAALVVIITIVVIASSGNDISAPNPNDPTYFSQ